MRGNRGKKGLGLLLLTLGLAVGLGQLHAFPLWLDAPSRSNPHDPLSTFFRSIPPSGPVATATPRPSASATPVVSATATPTQGSVLGSTPTPTPTPTATPTANPGGHGSMVQDFENNGANNVTYWNNGAISVNVDSYGSTISPDPWTAGSGTSGGAYGTSNYAGCISGTIAQSVGSNYPYCQLVMELTPGGSGVAGPAVDVTSYCPNKALTFDYKSAMAGVTYTVSLITPNVSDYGYYSYTFRPMDTNWHTLSVYFPGASNSPQFSQSPCFTARPFTENQVGAIEFGVVASTSAAIPYGLCVDNVTFGGGSSAAPPSHTGLVADFENGSGNDQTDWNYGGVLTLRDCFGSTMDSYPWTGTSGSAPGNGSATCARIRGVEAQSSGSNYPFCELALELVAGGSAAQGPSTDVTPYAPGQELTFDYSSASPGTSYTVALITPYVTDYGYYQYSFTPADSAWHTLSVYFPTAGMSPAFAQPVWAGAQTFDATRVGAVQFEVNASTSATTPYDLRVDNVKFQ